MRQPNPGSFNDKLSKLDVGERVFFETTRKGAHSLQSAASSPRLKPFIAEGAKFSSQVWTAVSTKDELTVLVSVTRIK